MTIRGDERPSADQRWIDRLVDGELDDDQRRALLARLDAEPDGWRRCALAFLEAQCWREALGPVSHRAKPRAVEAAAAPVASPAGALPRSRLALAAGMAAMAFALGMAAGGAIRPSGDRAAREGSLARGPRVPGPAAPSGAVSRADGPGGAAAIRTVATLEFGTPVDETTSPVKIPILAGPGLDERWLRARPSPVSEYVRARWERQGYEVEEHRRLVPVGLEDGRDAVIPVDEVKLHYVGRQLY
jgi:hypothetical protein